MYEKEFNVDNSKKLIVGISILFCAVIFVVGGTIAYFTQSDSEDISDIVTTDIENSLDYVDDITNVRGDLIPINEVDLVKAYNKEGEYKCKDDNGYNVCSIYKFTVYNKSNVSQSLVIDLIPKANSFHNLKFNLKDVTNNKEIMNNVKLIYLDETEINLLKNITLNGNSNITYELTFYIENKGTDQSLEDSGKRFGANIRVNSVTTGKYNLKGFGDECWVATDNNTKLTEFNGIDDNGNVLEICSGYVTKDENNLYSITIPSTYAGSDVTTIGNNLFGAYEATEGKRLYYKNIKSITIEEGITTIEDGYWDDDNDYFAFGYIGNYEEEDRTGNKTYNHYVAINLPSTLTYIGDWAFYDSGIKDLALPSILSVIGDNAFDSNDITTDVNNPLVIPTSVTTIGECAFNYNSKLTKLIFDGAEDDRSLLETIGERAFSGCGLDYQDSKNPLLLPSNKLYSIGSWALDNSSNCNQNLLYIQYNGKNSDILNNTNSWYISSITTLNPQ